MSIRRSWLILLLIVLLGGCASVGTGRQYTSSLVAFLYPKGQQRPLKAETATLHLPVKVGIAFVPSSDSSYSGQGFSRDTVPSAISMADQVRLMNEVAQHFRKYPFVKTVEVIPNIYLTRGGGFDNLDALASMYDVDIVALVSYDQVQHTDEGAMSLLYWTIVGAYTVPGEKNSTTTFVDTAVFDVASRKLLFRAPGISQNSGRGTPVDNSEELRNSSMQGFNVAFKKMIVNLDQSLKTFKQKVKNNPKEYRVEVSPGYGGGGAVAPWALLVLFFLLVVRLRRVLPLRRGAAVRDA